MIEFAGTSGTESVTLTNVGIQTTPELTSYINAIQPGGMLQFITQGDGYTLTVSERFYLIVQVL